MYESPDEADPSSVTRAPAVDVAATIWSIPAWATAGRFAWAINGETMFPAMLNVPPANRWPCESVVNERTLVDTAPLNPDPREDHALPFHFARDFAGSPPALLKLPPTYMPVPLTANAET